MASPVNSDVDKRPAAPHRPRRTAARPPVIAARDGGAGDGSLVHQTVEALRRAVLAAAGPGTFLGSEEELIASLGVSRPTFRQAARLLRHENLLTIKRGVGGGFFAGAPSVTAVSRMAAIYLNARGTSMRDINDVIAPLQAEAARMVARHPERGVRSRLLEFLHEGQHSGADAKHLMRRLLAFERLLAQTSGNPALGLVIEVLIDLMRDARRTRELRTSERVQAHEIYQLRLAQAIHEGNAEGAALICLRHGAEISRHLPEDKIAVAPAT